MRHSTVLSSVIPQNEIKLFREFVHDLSTLDTKHLLRNDIVLRFDVFMKEKSENNHLENDKSFLQEFFSRTQEMLLEEKDSIFMYRSRAAKYNFYRINDSADFLEHLTTDEFLDLREAIAGIPFVPSEKKLIIDFQPFYSTGPVIRDHRKIGSGQRFLNSFMAGKLQNETVKWHTQLCEFLKIHSVGDEQILVDGNLIKDYNHLFEAVQAAIEHLEKQPEGASFDTVQLYLRGLGFREGFGNTVGRALSTLQLLSNVLEEPSPDYLEQFISAIPMISRVAIISPHGWFGQENVLGRPDTGGPIVYILDQVMALDKYLRTALKNSGLSVKPKIIVLTRLIPEHDGTTSNQRLEKIHGTQNGWILRVPFRNKNNGVIPHWISRFHIWPYLEQFALESKNELQAEFGGKPDLIIGNYSDGNIVASLLSSWLNVIQCNIAHALEKTKYLFSDLYWEDMEEDYNFSLQFTADLIAMNKADIIISSTVQEIAGTEETLGQYESYCMFSMPRLFKVVNGINISHPKFNVVSPGVDQSIYFPYSQTSKRLKNHTKELTERLFKKNAEGIHGHLENPDKVPIFTMARLDKIKNLTGLVESFGLNLGLQAKANLIVVAGSIREEQVDDEEELNELKKMYRLINKYELHGKIRWIENASRVDGAEMYRIIADRKGIFVQPALFEAFGLTVLEAMASGLPIFATQFGGPLEIIADGKSGYLINPSQPHLISPLLLNFINRCEADPRHWQTISSGGIARVKEAYSWKLYSEKLLKFAKLYGFWNYSAFGDEKRKVDQYCNLLFHLVFKKRAEELGRTENG